jgi:hypothetical protein
MTKITVEKLEIEDGQYVYKSYSQELTPEEDFNIQEELLDKEMCRQGRLMLVYGDLMAEMKAMLTRKEENIKLVHAAEAARIRSQAESSGEKLTENKLAEKVLLAKDYQAALFDLHKCRADALRAINWWYSITKKAEILKALAYRQGQELKGDFD